MEITEELLIQRLAELEAQLNAVFGAKQEIERLLKLVTQPEADPKTEVSTD